MTIPRTRRYPRRPFPAPSVFVVVDVDPAEGSQVICRGWMIPRALPSVEQMYRWARNRTSEAQAYMTALAEGRVVDRFGPPPLLNVDSDDAQ